MPCASDFVVVSGREASALLGMIGVTQVGVEQLRSVWLLAVDRWFDGDEDGTDLVYKPRVLHFQYPASWRFCIRLQKPQAAWRILSCLRRCPDLEVMLGICRSIQIKSVKRERLAFRKEHASKCRTGVAVGIRVSYINDMQLSGECNQFPYIITSRRELAFLIERCTITNRNLLVELLRCEAVVARWHRR